MIQLQSKRKSWRETNDEQPETGGFRFGLRGEREPTGGGGGGGLMGLVDCSVGWSVGTVSSLASVQ